MSTLYLDASALVKRYSSEIGSTWVETQVDPAPGHSLVTAEFTMAEVAAAIADDDLLAAADAEGLSTENPNDYP